MLMPLAWSLVGFKGGPSRSNVPFPQGADARTASVRAMRGYRNSDIGLMATPTRTDMQSERSLTATRLAEAFVCSAEKATRQKRF
jgi:hypothetical protein